MFEYIKIDRRIIYYLIIIGFFYPLIIGIIYLLDWLIYFSQ